MEGSKESDKQERAAKESPAEAPASAGVLPAPVARPLWQWSVFALLLVLFTAGYFFFADILIRQTNQDRSKSDQQNNLVQAKMQSELEFDASEGWIEGTRKTLPHQTDGVVHPLWPWLASQVASENEESFFVQGKWLNVGLTLLFCLLFGLILFRRFSFFAALNLVLLAGFVVFLPRAVFFQPEPLFFLIFFLCWLCCLSLLNRHALWMYFLLGALAGLAYLAKSSIQPLLMAFSFLMLFLLVEQALFKSRASWKGRPQRPWIGTIVGLLLMASTFLIVISPLMVTARERWGSGFHTYPSYWMWMDDFDEGINFMVDHPSGESLEKLAPEEKPSAKKYWREHTGRQVWSRLADGVWRKTSLFAAPKRIEQKKKKPREEWKPWKHLLPERGAYLGVLMGMLLLAGGWSIWRRKRDVLSIGEAALPPAFSPGLAATGPILLFAAGSAVMFTLAYGWYTPIGRGDRFMMSLYLPLAFTIVLGLERVVSGVRKNGGAMSRRVGLVYGAAQLGLTIWILWRIAMVASFPYFQDSV